MKRRIQLRKSTIHGNGVFALRQIGAGARIVQYRGTVLTHGQADRLHEGTLDSGHTFLFTLNDRYVVDGGSGGNIARWINHSCEPNCEPVLDEDQTGDARRDRILIEATRDIAPGEELAYDYGIEMDLRLTREVKARWACRCNARRCRGTLLKPKRARRGG